MAEWDEVPDDVGEMRRSALMQAFTPAAPVDRKEVFAGRSEQLDALREVVWQKGQHAVIYGERGVGKTSLAKVAREVAAPRMFSAHVTCDSSDDYASIWRKVFEEIEIVTDSVNSTAAAEYLRESTEIRPNEVRVVLRQLTVEIPAVIFVDEFDVVTNLETRRAMAETVKVLSDQGISATIVIVGVAESVTGLIDEHASTERNLTQVPMPRMTLSERNEIISRGLARVEMSIADEAAQRISLLSQGLAQFVHLLAQRAAIIALNDGRDYVTLDDVSAAIKVALTDVHVSVSSAYYDAVKSNRDTLYPDVVLACALVAGDERGFFTAKALVEPMTRLEGRLMAIPAFGPHLDRLAGERGPILRKDGERRRFRYRFINPLMQPYVLMKGLQDERIRDSDLSGQ